MTTRSQQVRAARLALYDAGAVRTRTRRTIDTFPIGLRRATAEVLADLVERERAATTIETGLGLGLSALAILEGALRHTPSPQHTAIDPLQKSWADDAGRVSLESAGVAGLVRIFDEDSLLRMPALVAEGERFDLAFIDGGHWFEHALIDAVYALRLVRPGGLVILDDSWMPSVRAAAAYLATNMGCAIEPTGVAEVDQRVSVLRTPAVPAERPWDHFVPFVTRADRAAEVKYPSSSAPAPRATGAPRPSSAAAPR